MRDIKPLFVADATANHSPEEHRLALRFVGDVCGFLTTVDAISDEMRSAQQSG